MQRSYEIKKNKRSLEDGFGEEEKRRVSVVLTEKQIEKLDETLEEASRSRTLREIIRFFEKFSQDREAEQILCDLK